MLWYFYLLEQTKDREIKIREKQQTYLAPGRGPTSLAQSSPPDSSLVFFLPAPLRCSVEVHRRHRRHHRDPSRLQDPPPPSSWPTETPTPLWFFSPSSGSSSLFPLAIFRASPSARLAADVRP